MAHVFCSLHPLHLTRLVDKRVASATDWNPKTWKHVGKEGPFSVAGRVFVGRFAWRPFWWDRRPEKNKTWVFASRGQEMYIDIDRLRHANVPATGSARKSNKIYSSERKQPGKEGLKMNMKNGRLEQKHGIYNQPHRFQSKKLFSLEKTMHSLGPLVLKLIWNPNIGPNEKRRFLV